MWYNGFEYNFNARLPRGITLFGGGMSERVIAQVCDEQSNPNLLLYCDQTQSGIPWRTQFKIAGSVPVVYGVQASFSFQSLPGYRLGIPAQYALTGNSGPSGITTTQPAERCRHGVADHADDHATTPATRAWRRATVRSVQLVDPGMTVSSLNVPLIAPNTEYGDRINQLDLSFTRTFKIRPRVVPAEARLLQRAERVARHRRAYQHQRDALRHAVVHAAVVRARRPCVPARRNRSVLRRA